MNELTELLNSTHHKKEFSSGKDMLDNYLRHQASQDVKRKLAVCFVKTDPATLQVQGYYTLSNNSIAKALIPLDFQKKLPPAYQSIPVTLLGRLAIDHRSQGLGIGKLLLIDALYRCFILSKSAGSYAVIADPLDDDATSFYSKYGFIQLPDSGKMFLAMKTIEALFV